MKIEWLAYVIGVTLIMSHIPLGGVMHPLIAVNRIIEMHIQDRKIICLMVATNLNRKKHF